MPVVYHCPHCQQPVNVPDRMLGQAITCPKCRGAFQTQAPAPAPAPVPPTAGAFDFGAAPARESDDEDDKPRARRTPGGKGVANLSPAWQRVHYGIRLTRLAPVLAIFATVLAVAILVADGVASKGQTASGAAQVLALMVIAVPMLLDIVGRWMGTAVRDPNGQLFAWLATAGAGAFMLAWFAGALSGGRSRDAFDQVIVPLGQLVAGCVALGFWLRYLYWVGQKLKTPRLFAEVISFCWALAIGFVLVVMFVLGSAFAAVQSKNVSLLLGGVLLAGCVQLFVFVRYLQLLSAVLNTIKLRAPTRAEEAEEAEEAADDEDEGPLELD